MRIDAHHHFWQYYPINYEWINDDMEVLRRDFLPNDIHVIFDEHKIKGSIAVQARQSLAENDFLLALADLHEFIKGVVGWVDLLADDVEFQIRRYNYHPKFKGLRHILQSEPDGFMLQKAFIYGVKTALEMGLTYDILTYENQLTEVIEFISKLPELPMVIDHISKPKIVNNSFDEWAKHMETISKYDHIYVKLSGMVTEAKWDGWKPMHIRPYIDFCLEKFGPERLMFGSDWPVCTLAANYKQVLGLVENAISELSKDEQNMIMGDNALKFYKIRA